MPKYKYKYTPTSVLKLVDEFIVSNNYSMLLTFDDGEINDIKVVASVIRRVIPEEDIYCCTRGSNVIWFEKIDWKKGVF